MDVRIARDEDGARIPVIEHAASSLYAPYGLESALASVTTPTRRVERAVRSGELLVAVDEHDRAIGYALFAIFDRDLHLEELAVMPSHGRRGHGTALLHALAGEALRVGATRITLVTLDFVPFGQAFYAARGYAPMDTIPSFMTSLVDPDVRDGRVAMARTITRA